MRALKIVQVNGLIDSQASMSRINKENGSYRTLRGGSWDDNGNRVRCAFRYGRYFPQDYNGTFGFRVVISSPTH